MKRNRDRNWKDMNDKQLVESCLRGEVEEFQKIVDKYRGKVMALALNVLGNREDAEDACQEAFIHAYRHLDRFDVQRSFRSWLYTIISNLCMDQLRKRQRFQRFFRSLKRESSLMEKGLHSKKLPSESLPQGMLQELSPKERTALYLWAVEGYTSEEISSVLRCSPSTARVHLFRARKKIKAILEKENVSVQSH